MFDESLVTVTRSALRSGDYTVAGLEERVGLERKSLGDFVQTVIHDWIRFRKELNRLAGFDLAAIVIEANIGSIYRHEYESDAVPSAILGKINGIWCDHGIPVLFWEDRQTAADMAYRFFLLARKKFQ